MTIVAVLIIPARAALRWFDHFRKSPVIAVTVPDGGVIITGLCKRQRNGTLLRYGTGNGSTDRWSERTPTVMMTVTPRIIIPEEDEELVVLHPRFSLGLKLPDVKR